MAAPGGKRAWLRPDEVLFLDDAVTRCCDLLAFDKSAKSCAAGLQACSSCLSCTVREDTGMPA